ncbi:hypothetical protein [Microlunatus sp. GCM10028923]|uniref:hypothetical protein n=1 Tax=Microlunatus sp. GCM10028923 TaxID=3273400 RepID=UPI00361E2397
MYDYTSPELPNQRYGELLRAADQDRLARRILKEQKAASRAARRRGRHQPASYPVVRPA